MEILYYNFLETTRLKSLLDKTIERLKQDDFYSAEVKKLKNTPFYRAKLDYRHRLLFKMLHYQGKRYALLLEIIEGHSYDKSRFLRGAPVIEETDILEKIMQGPHTETESILYINDQKTTFHFLDKVISFDDVQEEIYRLPLPVMLIGTAGSGKTMLTLEKMKNCSGKILYLTHSSYLVENARQLYYAAGYEDEDQEIDFLSYREFLETLRIPEGREANLNLFSKWLMNLPRRGVLKDINKLYEEIKGVITGSQIEKTYLSREDYLSLGVKQSIYTQEERPEVYDLFERYLNFLQKEKLYDTNVISFQYLPLCEAKYDYLVVDEVQDFTIIQLYLAFKALSQKEHFLLCGDSHQIVHPNFFSWAKIKTLFYQQAFEQTRDITRILYKNYRNSQYITTLANKLLLIKNRRFGSIDKESTYLIETTAAQSGEVHYFQNTLENRNGLNEHTQRSIKFAVIVIDESAKTEVKQYFSTPLVFSVQEAKGLEYENVILYDFISSHERRYAEVTEGVSILDLEKSLNYARPKDKSDRSLEVYKFYVNAFYVAITRAIKNLYILEKIDHHPLFTLLGFAEFQQKVLLKTEESSTEEWQQEAVKLEMQGKQEQAQNIRERFLQKKMVPWTVLTGESLQKLKEKALNTQLTDKASRLLLFEYAVFYSDRILLEALNKAGFKTVYQLEKSWEMLEKKYFLFYSSSNTTRVLRDVEHYGVDFRNPFNQTPLMVASRIGNTTLVQALLKKGANTELVDNVGMNAFQIALLRAYQDKKYAQAKLKEIYALLSPSHLSLRSHDQLVKLDAKTMEYFLVNLMIAMLPQKYSQRSRWKLNAFSTEDFMKPLEAFPEIILPQRRKKRAYLSSILSKNEIERKDPYNRKLFKRVRHGFYTFSPELSLKVTENWLRLTVSTNGNSSPRHCEAA